MTNLKALSDMPIGFPGLFGGFEINPDPVALHIGHGIYWYGIILALGLLAGLYLCMKQAKRFGLTEDNVLDMILWATPLCIIGSRIYYVIFYLDLYRNADGGFDWLRMLAVWDGGIAIYGTVIVGILVAYVYCRIKKLKFAAMVDLCVMGLFLGQSIGRWGNFINREAFGAATDLPWRMQLWVSKYQTVEVHPTFLYESLWNLVGLLLVLFIVSRARRFDGESTCFYFLWYGLGRAWIEGLRTDSLYLFDWTIFGAPIRVSQALSLVLAVCAAAALFYNIVIRKKDGSDLWVRQMERAALAADGLEAEGAGTEENGSEMETAASEENDSEPETSERATSEPQEERPVLDEVMEEASADAVSEKERS
ncbi:prolipoprotein diacylglyceryl transferase [Oscillibacter sp. GMB15532]|uniref:prolipoprotein diacylglyceryl transferase n=1 Tax=Oscillibacter sp. GMB15532 TaxID=3230022 RepID=UPI0034E04880